MCTFGFDHTLPHFVMLTFDAMYTKAVYTPFMNNLGARRSGEGWSGNPVKDARTPASMYGTISATGVASPLLKTPNMSNGGDDLENSSKDYAYSLSFGLRKRFAGSIEASAAYTYQRSAAARTSTSSVASSNFRNGRETAGFIDDKKDIAPSAFDRPHRAVASLTDTALAGNKI